MNRLGIPKTLAEDNRRLVAGSPLLLAVLLDKAEYRPGALSGFYSVFGMGAAVENVWLATTELGMGIQFVSTPMEVPANWARLARHFAVHEDLTGRARSASAPRSMCSAIRPNRPRLIP